MTQIRASAAGRLLDRDLPGKYLDETTEVVSAEKRTSDTGTESVLIFRIGLEWLALPARIFQEVTEPRRIHKLPHRVGGILRGLVNVRGDLILCVALDALLGTQVTAKADSSKNETAERLLVCNRKGSVLAFLANEVHGVQQYHPRELREIPATVAKAAANFTLGVLHWREETVGCLDDELLFYALNKGFA